MRRVLHAALSLSIISLCVPSASWAVTINVTTYADVADPTPDGVCDSCSLREAIQEANFLPGPDVILLPPGTYNLTIAGADEDAGLTGDLDITDDVTIIGIGTTIIESNVGRVIHVLSGNVSITGLTLTQGDANNDQSSGSAGGAVHNAAGSTLTLNHCTMSINQAQGGGGAIFNAGTLSINASTMYTNSAVGTSRGGAVYNSGTMTITNCTLSGNSSTDGGGGIYTGPGSTLILNNTTLIDNASTGGVGGGGINADATSTVTISNTIMANNTAAGPDDDCEAVLTSLGSNIVKDVDGCTGLGAGDITLVDPLLGPLQDNGGRSLTREPLAGSPALDAGGSSGACEATDERGLARPQGTACDIGAVEIFPSCPAITLEPATLPDGQAGQFYSQTLAPSGGVPPYQFAVTAGRLPDGLALDPVRGTLSGVPTKSGGNNFTLTAFDATFCPVSLAYTLNIASGPSCSPTTITLSPKLLPGAIPGVAYSQTLDPNGGVPPYLFSVTQGTLPPSLDLDPNTGTIAGTPSVSGTFVFAATATDVDTCTGSQGYALQVACLFTFSPSSLPNATEGTPYEQDLTIATGGTPPYAFAVVSGSLPPGLSLTGTGALTGTPTTPGIYTFLLEATDANFCTGKLGYILEVDPCITITQTTLPDGVVGTAYSATVTATGGSAPLSFSVSGGALPPDLSLDPNGPITGTPTAPGISFLTVKATDGSCSAEQSYFLVVDPTGCPGVAITPATLPNDTEGNNYNQNLTGTGGASPYAFQVVAGTPPTGLSLSAGGNLAGTCLAPGIFDFTVAATDSDECSATQAYSILIAPTSCSALDLFPPVLPNGSRGLAYQQRLLASGGIAPYSYAVTAGTLPPGLALDAVAGVLSGTPTDLGDFTFTLTATDAVACSVSVEYTVTILPDLRGANCAFFGDTFEDGLLAPNWTYVKPTWSESGGNLVGRSGKKALTVASPAFAGCLDCQIETTMRTAKAGTTKIGLLGWYVSKKNFMELTAAAGTDIWMLKQVVGGNVVAKAKAKKVINPNVTYDVKIAFDGTKFTVYVDDLTTPLFSLTPKKTVQPGTVGLEAKGTTGTFGFICVN